MSIRLKQFLLVFLPIAAFLYKTKPTSIILIGFVSTRQSACFIGYSTTRLFSGVFLCLGEVLFGGLAECAFEGADEVAGIGKAAFFGCLLLGFSLPQKG